MDVSHLVSEEQNRSPHSPRPGLLSFWNVAECSEMVNMISFLDAFKQQRIEVDMVALPSNSSPWETEAGASIILGQPGMTESQKSKTKINQKNPKANQQTKTWHGEARWMDWQDRWTKKKKREPRTLCSRGWPRSHSDPPAPAFRMLGMKACAIIPGCNKILIAHFWDDGIPKVSVRSINVLQQFILDHTIMKYRSSNWILRISSQFIQQIFKFLLGPAIYQ